MNIPRKIPTPKTPDIVTYAIRVNDREIPFTIMVKSVLVQREVNKIPSATIRINDGDRSKEDFEISNLELFVPGNSIEIDLGYRSENTTIFKGIVISHKNRISADFSELVVECRDKAVVLTSGRKMRHFENMGDDEIVNEILSENNLKGDVESASTVYEDVIQYSMSDWDFIVSRMDRIGNICVVSDGEISFFTPKTDAEPVLELLYGATIIDYHAEIDSRTHFPGVSVNTWDYTNQEMVDTDVDTPQKWENEAGNLTSKELSDVFEKRSDSFFSSAKFSLDEQQAIADAKLGKQRLSKIRGSVIFNGYPHITPGDFIGLNGVGERFEGSVFVNALTQHFEDGEWTTEVDFGMSPEWFAEKINPYANSSDLGRLSNVNGLMIGVAEELEDPAGEGRVRIRIPTVSNQNATCWARVASLDAGDGRGAFFLPETGDEVVVGFIENDPAQAIILGMLNSSAKPAPFVASDENPEKGFVSRDGLKFIFNDSEKSVKIETPAGKRVFINDQENLILLEDENSNSVIMSQSGITIQSGTELEISAQSSIKIKAPVISVEGSNVSISSDGITEVKGSLVKIN